MAEPDIISALRDKRTELAGVVKRLEQQLAQHRVNLAHVDATMLLFEPGIAADTLAANQQRARNDWFRQGECLRLIYDVLRGAPHPLPTREVAERVMTAKGIQDDGGRTRELIQKTVLGSLNRKPETIERVEAAGAVAWRVI